MRFVRPLIFIGLAFLASSAQALVTGAAAYKVNGSSIVVYQGDGWSMSQSGSYTVTPGTGTWSTSGSSVTAFQGGAPWVVSQQAPWAVVGGTFSIVGTTLPVQVTNIPAVSQSGAWNVGQVGSYTVTPGTGIWSTSGSTVVVQGYTSTSTVYQGGAPWSVNQSTVYIQNTPGGSIAISVGNAAGVPTQVGYSVNGGSVPTNVLATVTPSDIITGQGTINAAGSTYTVTGLHGVGSALISLSGAWVGYVNVQSSVDGVIWSTNSTSIPGVSSFSMTGITSTGTFRIPVVGGFQQIRAIFSSYTSGSATVQFYLSAPVADPFVFQTIAANLNAQVVGNVSSGTADSGNGVKVSGVYNSTAPVLSSGQRSDLQTDANGNLYTAPVLDRNIIGTIASTNAFVAINTQGEAIVGWTTTGTWVGTMTSEVTYDGINWFAAQSIDTDFVDLGKNIIVTSWGHGLDGDPWTTNVSGAQQFRIRASSWTSGVSTITLNASPVAGPMAIYQTNSSNINAQVVGTVSTGTAFGGNPVINGGVDGGNIARDLYVDSNGSTREAKDVGRQVIIASATSVGGTTTDTIFTLTVSTAFTNSTSGTSFGVPSGKTLRIQNLTCVWRETASLIGGGTCRLRVTSSGSCTVASPQVMAVGSINTAVNAVQLANDAPTDHADFPDGFEISGTQQFCISHLDAAAVNVDVMLVGYQY